MTKQATRLQQRKFFALCKALNISTERAMKRAKEACHIESFTEITSDQISVFIDLLQEKLEAAPTVKQVKERILALYEKAECCTDFEKAVIDYIQKL